MIGSISGPPSRRRTVLVIVAGVLDAGRRAPLQPEDALDDRAGHQEEQDHRLEDADELGRDAGLDLHRRQRRRASPRTAGRRQTMPIGLVRPSSATAMASKPTVVPYDAVMWWVTPRSSVAPARPASIPATRHRPDDR